MRTLPWHPKLLLLLQNMLLNCGGGVVRFVEPVGDLTLFVLYCEASLNYLACRCWHLLCQQQLRKLGRFPSTSLPSLHASANLQASRSRLTDGRRGRDNGWPHESKITL